MLTHTEEALVRGWIQGVSWKSLGETYLEDGDSMEVIRTIHSLREHLAAKARVVRPEMVGFWTQERGYTLAWQHRALDLLETLQRLPDPIPTRKDPVTAWFPPRLAGRLTAHGLATLGDLIVTLEAHGPGWWRTLPGVGWATAQALKQWFTAHLTDLALSEVPGSCPPPLPAPILHSSGIVPLERFFAPPHLDGQNGTNRPPRSSCRLPVDNDVEAILAWLAQWDAQSATFRAYRKEAERFLLWAICRQQTPLSSLTTLHCAGYRKFLQNPEPSGQWVGPMVARADPRWRPFLGPLSPRSQRQAETILSSMAQWWVDQGYWSTNPFKGLNRPRRPADKIAVDRSFSFNQWQTILKVCHEKIKEAQTPREARRHRRNAYLLEFAYGTGMRLQELAQARVGDLTERDEQWWLTVLGKGKKVRNVPIPPPLLEEIEASLHDRGLPAVQQAEPETPLIGRVNGDAFQPLTCAGLHRSFRTLFRQLAAEIHNEDPKLAERLWVSSAHWLRHTHGSHAAANNLPLTMIRDTLGHANVATTSLYAHTDDEARYRAYKKLFKRNKREELCS